MPALTWRSVTAPDFSSTARIQGLASAAFDNALNNAKQGLTDYKSGRESEADALIRKRALVFNDPEQLQTAIAGGQITQGLNDNFVTPGSMEWLGNRGSALLENQVNTLNFQNQKRDAEEKIEADTWIRNNPQYNQAISTILNNPEKAGEIFSQLSQSAPQSVVKRLRASLDPNIGTGSTIQGLGLSAEQRQASREADELWQRALASGKLNSLEGVTAFNREALGRGDLVGRLLAQKVNSLDPSVNTPDYQYVAGMLSGQGGGAGMPAGGSRSPSAGLSGIGGTQGTSTSYTPAKASMAASMPAVGSWKPPQSSNSYPTAWNGVPTSSIPGDGTNPTYDSVYGNGNYLVPDKPVTEMTLDEVKNFGQEQIKATAGKINKGNKGTSAIGRYQFVNSTLFDENLAEEVFGKDWKNVAFTPENQDKLAEALFEKRKNSNLADTWEGLKNTVWDQTGYGADKSFKELQQAIEGKETSSPWTESEANSALTGSFDGIPVPYSPTAVESAQTAEATGRMGSKAGSANIGLNRRLVEAFDNTGTADSPPVTKASAAKTVSEKLGGDRGNLPLGNVSSAIDAIEKRLLAENLPSNPAVIQTALLDASGVNRGWKFGWFGSKGGITDAAINDVVDKVREAVDSRAIGTLYTAQSGQITETQQQLDQARQYASGLQQLISNDPRLANSPEAQSQLNRAIQNVRMLEAQVDTARRAGTIQSSNTNRTSNNSNELNSNNNNTPPKSSKEPTRGNNKDISQKVNNRLNNLLASASNNESREKSDLSPEQYVEQVRDSNIRRLDRKIAERSKIIENNIESGRDVSSHSLMLNKLLNEKAAYESYNTPEPDSNVSNSNATSEELETLKSDIEAVNKELKNTTNSVTKTLLKKELDRLKMRKAMLEKA